MTTYTYTDGEITQAVVTVNGAQTETTTYAYTDGVLTGVTTA